jgi:hypothetical protein
MVFPILLKPRYRLTRFDLRPPNGLNIGEKFVWVKLNPLPPDSSALDMRVSSCKASELFRACCSLTLVNASLSADWLKDLLATVPSPISFGADSKGLFPSFLAVVALDFIDPGLHIAFLIISA